MPYYRKGTVSSIVTCAVLTTLCAVALAGGAAGQLTTLFNEPKSTPIVTSKSTLPVRSTAQPLPTPTPPSQHNVAGRLPDSTEYFYAPETSHAVSAFSDVFIQNGGVYGFGLPLTEPFVEERGGATSAFWVQYFEKAVVEYHPEFADANQFQLTALGTEALQAKYPSGSPAAKPLNDGASYKFPETGYIVEGPFLSRWYSGGELRRFGYPITDAFDELSDADGKTYRVQYFERAVMQYHPELTPPQDIQLVPLGTTRLMRLYDSHVPDNAADPVPAPTVNRAATEATKQQAMSATATAQEVRDGLQRTNAAHATETAVSRAALVPQPQPPKPQTIPGCTTGARYGAVCNDGSRSNATGRGACSHHGGVNHWLVCP